VCVGSPVCTPVPGLTDPLTRTTLQGVTSGLNGTASGSAQTTVLPATPTVATTSNPNTSVPIGSSVTDTANVSGPAGAVTPTGTVAFFLCQPAQVTAAGCPAGGTQVGAAKTLANGSATSDATTNTNTPGKYCWRAQYSGDSNYSAASHTDATAECFNVLRPPVELTTQPSPNNGTVGQTALSDIATLSGGSNLTGTLTFNLFPPSDTTCSGLPVFSSVVTVNGAGSYSSATFPAASVNVDGTWHWVVIYSGDASGNEARTSGCADEPVVIIPPAVPTLSEWGMILFVMILVGVGALMLRRRNASIG